MVVRVKQRGRHDAEVPSTRADQESCEAGVQDIHVGQESYEVGVQNVCVGRESCEEAWTEGSM